MTGAEVVVGPSWKMNGTLKDARAFACALRAASLPANVLPFVIPSFTAIATVWHTSPSGRSERRGDNATTDQVRKALEPVRDEWSGRIRGLLYGGSVNRDNAADLLGVEGLDGLFVGWAAWNPSGYL